MKNEYENLIKNKIIRRGSMRKNYAEDLIKSIQRKNEINMKLLPESLFSEKFFLLIKTL